MKNFMALFLLLFGFALPTFAAERPALSYDVGGATGSYNGDSYSEIHLGLNWFAQDWMNWRNSLFTQFGSTINTVYGLDSALLFEYSAYTQGRGAGVELFAGPGLRFATEKSNAVFGQAGVIFNLGGLHIGGGVQQLHYTDDRTDKNNYSLPKDETQYFIILSGGGVF
jgi:hypothetical protein